MTALAEILDDRGLNPNQLAKKIGVSGPNAYKWRDGTQAIPAKHAAALADLLRLTVEERAALDEQVSEEAHAGSLAEADGIVTYFGYSFRSNFRNPEETYAQTVQRFAKLTEINAGVLGQYLSGDRLIPLSAVKVLANALAPLKPEWVIGGLAYEVDATGDETDEWFRVRNLLAVADDVADAEAILAEFKATAPERKTMDPAAVLEALGVNPKDVHPKSTEIAMELADKRKNS